MSFSQEQLEQMLKAAALKLPAPITVRERIQLKIREWRNEHVWDHDPAVVYLGYLAMGELHRELKAIFEQYPDHVLMFTGNTLQSPNASILDSQIYGLRIMGQTGDPNEITIG